MRSDKLESVVFTVITKYIDLAVDMEHLLKKIHDSPKKKAASNRLSDLLHAKEKEREKIEGILLDLYPDLKSGIISRSQYLLLKQRYDSEIKEINQAISNIRQTLNLTKYILWMERMILSDISGSIETLTNSQEKS